MFLLRFFRFLTGYVVFTATGGFPERFINLCSMNNINLWDTKTSDGILTSKTTIGCYKKIRKCAKKSGMKLKAQEKHGFPFIIKPYVQRKGLFAGAIISVILIFVLSSCIWTVSIDGNEKLTDRQIENIIELYGIKIGSFKKNIDIRAVREDIKTKFDTISWFTVNIDGTSLSVKVLESTGNNKILDLTTPCNIISSTDGELVRLEVYTGEPALTIGNAVTKGDLLISGVVENSDGSSDFVHARGNAVVRTKKEINSHIPYSLKCKKISQIKKIYTLSAFSLNIPLGKTEKNTTDRTEKNMLNYNNLSLPLGIITNINITLDETKINLSDNQAILLCEYDTFIQEKELMNNAENEKKTVTIEKNEKLSITICYINHEKCGIENYFIVENQ